MRKGKIMKNRIISAFLTVFLLVGLIPASVGAADGDLMFSLNIGSDGAVTDTSGNGNTVTKGTGIETSSFLNKNGEKIPYIQFEYQDGNNQTDQVKVDFANAIEGETDKVGSVTVEFWANVSDNTYSNYQKLFGIKDSNECVFDMETVNGCEDNNGRYTAVKGKANGIYLGSSKGGADVLDKWAHYVITYGVSSSSESGKSTYVATAYVNGEQMSTGKQDFKTFGKLVALHIGHYDSTDVITYKLASFKVYEGVKADAANNYEKEKDKYTEDPISVTSHTSGGKAVYPAELKGTTTATSKQTLKIKIGDGSYENVTVTDGAWSYKLKEGSFGEKKITLAIFNNADETVAQSKELTLDFVREHTISDLSASINADEAVTGSLKMTANVERTKRCKVYAVLFRDGKMLECVEAANGTDNNYSFKMREMYASVDGLYVKAFAFDNQDNLVSNAAVTPGNAKDPSVKAETLTEPATGNVSVGVTQLEEENSFKITALSGRKYANDAVVTVKDPDNNIDYLNVISVDGDGYAAVKYAMNSVTENKAYTVLVAVNTDSGEVSFKKFSQEKINGVLSAIEEASGNNLQSSVFANSEYSEILALDMTNYDSLKSDLAREERIAKINEELAGKKYASLGDFKSKFASLSEEQAVLYEMEKTAADGYASKLASKNGFIAAKLDGLYKELSAEQKKALFTEVEKGTYYKYADLSGAIANELGLYVIKNFTSDDIISKTIIEKYSKELGIGDDDKATYSAMEKKNRKKVLERVKAAAITAFSGIGTAFKEAVAYVSDPKNISYSPIMTSDFTNADKSGTDTAKGITLSGTGMSVEEAAFSGTGKYQTKNGGKVSYLELKGESSKVVINLGKPTVKEGTLSFWANIDSTNISGSSVSMFSLTSGKTEIIKGRYWLHANAGKSFAMQVPYSNPNERYTSGDAFFDNWNHYVLAYKWNDDNTELSYSLYINGVWKNGIPSTTDKFKSGTIPTVSDDFKLTLSGGENIRIADVKYYNEGIMEEDYVESLYAKELETHDPAAVNLNYDGETVAYPYTLNGEVIKDGNQTLEISEDGTKYTEVTVNNGKWSYKFADGVLGERNIKFRIKNANDTTAQEMTVAMKFGYPLVLSNADNTGVKVTNIRKAGDGSAAINGEIVAVVYDGAKIYSMYQQPVTALASGASADVKSFTPGEISGNKFVKFFALDSVADMNILSDSVLYPTTAGEPTATAASISAGESGINGDVSYTPDTWETVITVVTTDKAKNAVLTVKDSDGNIVYIGETALDENGKGAVGFTPEIVTEDSNYTVAIKAGAKTKSMIFRYNGTTAINKTLAAVKGSTADNFETDILGNDTHKYALAVDLEGFNALGQYWKDNVSAKVAGKDYADAAAFKTDFLAAVAEQTMLQELYNATSANADSLLKQYETALGITLSEAYDILNTSSGQAYKTQLLNNAVFRKQYAAATEFKTGFFENSMVSLFNFYQTIQIVDNGIMQSYAARFNLNTADINAYTNYTRDKKIAVIDAMKTTGIGQYASLKTVFNSSLSAEPQNGGGGNPGGGGGGGGGFSVVAPSSKDNIPEEVDEEQALATADSIFRDLRVDHWAYQSIAKLVELGVLNGVGGGKFEPESVVTREQFVKMILEALGIEADENAVCYFDDVDKSDWCYKYVATAYALGIVEGVTDNHFGKGASITRAEMCTMICRAVEHSFNRITPSGDGTSFIDQSSVPAYAVEYIGLLNRAGVINGYEDNSFRPNDTATRAAAAKVIDNLLNNFN